MTSTAGRFLGLMLVASMTGAAACASSPDAASSSTSTADAGVSVADQVNAGRPAEVRLCYTATSQAHPARRAFWDALRSGDTTMRAQVIADLEAAATALPNEEELALLLGLAHLWRLAEPTSAESSDVSITVQSAARAKAELERAYTLCPTDHRIPAWLGPVLINGGRAMGNAQMVEQGFTVLQQGIDHYPQFVLFSKLLAYANEPADSADFTKALDAVSANIGYRGSGETLRADPACMNTFQAAHNIEGSMVFLGDVYAKAGKKDDALGFYAQAKSSGTYSAWQWKDLLDERVRTIDARVAAFRTTATTDDPASAWTSNVQCSICHRQ